MPHPSIWSVRFIFLWSLWFSSFSSRSYKPRAINERECKPLFPEALSISPPPPRLSQIRIYINSFLGGKPTVRNYDFRRDTYMKVIWKGECGQGSASVGGRLRTLRRLRRSRRVTPKTTTVTQTPMVNCKVRRLTSTTSLCIKGMEWKRTVVYGLCSPVKCTISKL